MPKPKEEAPEIKESEIKPGEEVTVELDDNNEPIKAAEKQKEEPRYVRPEDLEEKLKKQNAQYFHEQRKLSEKIDKLTSHLQTPAQPAKKEEPADEWDLKIQKDWKGTVRELARLEAQELRRQEVEQSRVHNEQEKRVTLLEGNKRKVLDKHPELEDSASDKAVVFQKIISQNPDYLYDPFGPVLAMRDMEDELRSRGQIIDEPTKNIVDKEVNRRARTNASAVPQGSSANGNKIVLTKDEREFCDHNGIKYDAYAKNRKMTSNQGTVQV